MRAEERIAQLFEAEKKGRLCEQLGQLQSRLVELEMPIANSDLGQISQDNMP